MNNTKDMSFFIIDDDPVCSELYKQYLLNMGFNNIAVFDNGQESINSLTKKPDVVLLDHHMAPINGLETLKKIKRFDPDIYLIYISAQKDMKVAIDALKYGAFDYIIKGDMEAELLAAIIQKMVTVNGMLKQSPPQRFAKLFSFFSI